MHERDVTFNGTRLVQGIGLIYSNFEEVLPEPVTSYVQIVGGDAVDVSDSSGSMGYGMGTHVLTFLLNATDQADRLAKKSQIISLLHGKKANYTLSWVSGTTFNGRGAVQFEHLWDNIDVVTITITYKNPY